MNDGRFCDGVVVHVFAFESWNLKKRKHVHGKGFGKGEDGVCMWLND